MFTDSHCHINAADFADDREETVQRAREMQITYILDVCDDIADMPRLLDFCAKHKQIYTTAGVHPELAYKYPDFTAEQILEQAKSPYVVGVGECGLDYYYNADIKEQQLKVLAQIEQFQKYLQKIDYKVKLYEEAVKLGSFEKAMKKFSS